ncbi:MAG: Gfo/Idh/MocA family oxidoreductase [Negativicutes bacterium]
MRRKIAIVGAGQIGSRHLQALAKLEGEVFIQVVDSSSEALQLARARFTDVSRSDKSNITVEYLNIIDEMDDSFDVIIVATNSNVRRIVAEELLNKKQCKHLILEKVVFQSCEDFADISELLIENNVRAWVNCPRRMWTIYHYLHNKLKHAENVSYCVSGAGQGIIGSNGIHYIDSFSHLTGETDIAFCSKLLDEKLTPSKRQGFVEFTGVLEGVTESGKQIKLSCYATGNAPIMVNIDSEVLRCIIIEEAGTAWISEECNNWKWEEMKFLAAYQSQLTNIVVEQLIETGGCDLTSFEVSRKLHEMLLNSLMEYLFRNHKGRFTICPIT